VERVEVELFSDGGNNAIVRMPGREFPGMVVQGDTLSTLWVDVTEAADSARVAGVPAEVQSGLDLLTARLGEMLQRYERALNEHGLRKPYVLPPRP